MTDMQKAIASSQPIWLEGGGWALPSMRISGIFVSVSDVMRLARRALWKNA